MKLQVDRLTDTPSDLRFEGSPAWWAGGPAGRVYPPHAVVEPFRFELKAHRMGTDLYLEGMVSASLEVECSRCLARYRHSLRESLRLVLQPAGDRVPAEPEAAVALERDGLGLGDELDSGWFRGNQIDLENFFREVVGLALPTQPLCREDCLGLCPRCGADRNTNRCDCGEARPDSPFRALAALRDGRGRGGN